ncbi:MAG: DNA/RNA helicase [Deltaproteobacteria bacterium]|nr:MAG: DNA/RNA helicase [Deltaproteobacteria bacterium]
MNVHQVPHGGMTAVGVRPARGDAFGLEVRPKTEVFLFFNETTDELLMKVGDHAISITGENPGDNETLGRLRSKGLPRICWVAAALPTKVETRRITLQIHEFPARYEWPETVDLGIDDKVVEDVRRREDKIINVAGVVDWLTERVLLVPFEPGGLIRALLTGSPDLQGEKKTAFRLHGVGISIDVSRTKENRLLVTRIVQSKRSDRLEERRPVILVQGNIRFCDLTMAGQFRGTARSMLDQMVAGAGSYLKLWGDYNHIERESILKRARALGWLSYKGKPELLREGIWRFSLKDAPNVDTVLSAIFDNEDVSLEVAEAPPSELHSSGGRDGAGEEVKKSRVAFVGKPVAYNLNAKTIDLSSSRGDDDTIPPRDGAIFMSLSGDRKRLKRRELALRSIVTAECRMPELGLIIERAPIHERRGKTWQPLSGAVKAAFGAEPTARQIEALKVAINTPDIALIQGPPGTGKTMVIAALQSRLAEIAEESRGISGQTLLTSYQHDAVENAAERTVVYGLPAIKVGRRRGQDTEDDGFERWRKERVDAVRADLAQFPTRPVTEALKRVRDIAAAYVGSPTGMEDAIQALASVRSEGGDHFQAELKDRFLTLQLQLQKGHLLKGGLAAEDTDFAMKAVRGLRVEPTTFGDDGPQSAYRVLSRIDSNGQLDEQERALLERAAEWPDPDAPPPFLQELEQLKGVLLDRLQGDQRPLGVRLVNDDVQALLVEAVEALYQRARQTAGGEEVVLSEYLDDLENDSESMRDSIREYTAVLAATCQQAVGYRMSIIKGGESASLWEAEPNSIVFENVVVDEAARANPLDLLIPLSCAERRIILVGDHRQLPHILEPDVELQLEESVLEATRDSLRKSMFWRLFEDMRERERVDGIKRTVTLDVQYRMHPILGDFVSDTFYKPHGESFRSGRPASDFVHGLERYRDAVAAWVNIPYSAGSEKGKQSKFRPVEARWIAKETKRMLELRSDLSVGIISFYSAQVDEINKALSMNGLTEQLDNGSFAVAPAWRELLDSNGKLKDRLRVGTVDAFQGKEFDVVILSMTRSNEFPSGGGKTLRRKFGHLMLENRLCVAMSRQQRLLIVVGDEGMLTVNDASEAIPGLIAFHDLCGGEHGIRLSA